MCSESETLVKGSYNDRIHFLFEFYDIERRSGISYDCLLKMVSLAEYSSTATQRRS